MEEYDPETGEEIKEPYAVITSPSKSQVKVSFDTVDRLSSRVINRKGIPVDDLSGFYFIDSPHIGLAYVINGDDLRKTLPQTFERLEKMATGDDLPF